MKHIKGLFGKGGSQSFLLLMAMVFIPGLAAAFATPAAGDLGFGVYDFLFNQVVGGVGGATAAGIAILVGVTTLFRSWLGVIVGMIVAGVVVNLEALVVAAGYIA